MPLLVAWKSIFPKCFGDLLFDVYFLLFSHKHLSEKTLVSAWPDFWLAERMFFLPQHHDGVLKTAFPPLWSPCVSSREQHAAVTDDLVVDNHTRAETICLHRAVIGNITQPDIYSLHHPSWEWDFAFCSINKLQEVIYQIEDVLRQPKRTLIL